MKEKLYDAERDKMKKLQKSETILNLSKVRREICGGSPN